ncbi:unnamed protein product [Rotaria sp. Silwood2]|nr:unnamed protein product [Rotaria sp. Silwood2]CAF4370208.1 unnamed protein product [Rotaria sp. Silwood2]
MSIDLRPAVDYGLQYNSLIDEIRKGIHRVPKNDLFRSVKNWSNGRSGLCVSRSGSEPEWNTFKVTWGPNPLIAGTDSYVLTAYFVDPRTICTSGRDEARLKLEGSGTGLWLQNGSDPIRDSVPIPLHENTINTTRWVLGSCFPSMGVHYWYDNRLDKECDEIFPVFLLYNKGKLTGFGWGLAGKYEYTKRTEPVPYGAVSVRITQTF